MARRKRTIIEELQPDPSPSEGSGEVVPTEDDLQREEEIQNFVQSFGGDVCRVSVYRLNKAGKLAYVGSLSPGAVTESLIQETYGEGEYNIRLLDERGKFLMRRSIVIEGPRRETGPGPGLAANSDGNRVQIEMLQQQMMRQHEMLLAMIQKAGNSGSSATELAAALVQLRNLAKPTESKPADALESIRSAIELLNEGIKLAGKTARGGNEGESKLETWRGILEAVPGIVSAVSTLRPGQTAAIPAAPSPGAPLPNNPRIGEQPGVELVFLKQAFAYLKGKAAAGKSVDLMIDWIAENLDEPPWLPLTQRILAMPFEELGSIDPDTQVEPLRSWFYQLYHGLKQVLEERAAQASSQNAGEEEG